jgi:hypothetical protein
MNRRCVRTSLPLLVSALTSAAVFVHARAGAETFTATATVKTAAGSTATAPVVIVVDQRLSQKEADELRAALTKGGAAALRKALGGRPAAGSVKLGDGTPTPTQFALERPTPKGRLLTIVADKPILHLGAGVPPAAPKEGYDFALIDLEVDANGNGSGTMSPAAKVTVKQEAFVVDDYASELIQLKDVKKVK